jgi:hypothetical protein
MMPTIVVVSFPCSRSQSCTPFIFLAGCKDCRCRAIFSQLRISAVKWWRVHFSYPLCVVLVINLWYRSFQVRNSVKTPSLLEANDCTCDYRTRYHSGSDELRIARLCRPRDPRGHFECKREVNEKFTRLDKKIHLLREEDYSSHPVVLTQL